MSATTKIQQMINTLTETLKDAEKADKGNKAAGTRVRATAQTIKSECQNLRAEVLSSQKTTTTTTTAG